MGETKTYRWERRRRRHARRNKTKAMAAFWGFEVILLILIFSVWAIGARFVLIFAITTSPCAEAVAAFGQSSWGLSAFDLLFWICILMVLFWLTLTLLFWQPIWRSKTLLAHLSLLCAIMLLTAHFKLMLVDNNVSPDGVLSIRNTVRDMSSGEPRYAPIELYGDEYSGWYLGPPDQTIDVRYHSTLQRCVWLDHNIIMDEDFIDKKGYVDATTEERKEMFDGRLKLVAQWEPLSFSEQIKLLYSGVLKGAPSLQSLKSLQQYRPLFPEERARFRAKQTCLHKNRFEPKRYSICRYYWGVDIEAEDRAWLNSQ